MNCPACGKKMIPEVGCPDCDIELNIGDNREHMVDETENETGPIIRKSPWYIFWYVLLGIALIGIIANIVISGLAGAKIEPDTLKDTAIILAVLFTIRAHQMSKSKILWGIIGFAVGMAIAFVLIASTTAIANKKHGVQRMLKREAEKISASLPKMSPDGETQIISVAADDKTLSFKIMYPKSIKYDFNENVINSYKTNLINEACKQHEISEMLKSGVIIEYNYVDKNSEAVFLSKIKNEDCK